MPEEQAKRSSQKELSAYFFETGHRDALNRNEVRHDARSYIRGYEQALREKRERKNKEENRNRR